jgi:hypothetical protein
LERTETELARVQNELVRLRALTDETRARLSAFLAAGLQALDKGEKEEDGSPRAPGDLQDALQAQLVPASQPGPTPVAQVDNPLL